MAQNPKVSIQLGNFTAPTATTIVPSRTPSVGLDENDESGKGNDIEAIYKT